MHVQCAKGKADKIMFCFWQTLWLSLLSIQSFSLILLFLCYFGVYVNQMVFIRRFAKSSSKKKSSLQTPKQKNVITWYFPRPQKEYPPKKSKFCNVSTVQCVVTDIVSECPISHGSKFNNLEGLSLKGWCLFCSWDGLLGCFFHAIAIFWRKLGQET